MKKRVVALTMAGLMAMSLAACGGSSGSSTATTAAPAETKAQAETTAAATEAAAAPAGDAIVLKWSEVNGDEYGVTSYLSNSFNEVAPYFITDAHTFGCGVILMNKDKWNSLTDEQKGWMQEASAAASKACYEYNQKQEQAAFDSFAEKGATKLEVADIDKWQEAVQSVYATYDADDQEMIKKLGSGSY